MSAWYFNKNLKPQGPFSFEEMKRKITRGEVGPQEFVCKDGQEQWLPASQWKEFPQEFFPALQKDLFRNMSRTEKEWTLLSMPAGSSAPVQQGPYSLNEIRSLLANGEITLEDHIWRTGLSGWVRIADRPECFTSLEI